ncbi:MAG: U32 family peptidase C-terminal domain-containing protein, partial [Eubacteriales bacterium]|nr:U32 family peptidase C-terminal domain-containing protein [Eubacteriales bacterium]
RKAIDDYKESREKFEANFDYYHEEIAKCTYRQFTTGFYYGKTDENSQIYDANTYIKEYTYVGIVQKVDEQGRCMIYQRNKFCVGDEIEVMIPDGTNETYTVKALYNEKGESVESAPHPKQEIWIDFGAPLKEGYLLRKQG